MSYNPGNLQPGDTGVFGSVVSIHWVPWLNLFVGLVGNIDGSDFYSIGELSGNTGRAPLTFMSADAFAVGQNVRFTVSETNQVLVAIAVVAA